MDGRNRPIIFIRLPPELKVLLFCYQSASKTVSLNAAVIRLLETHPVLVRMAEELYNDTKALTEHERHANGSGHYPLASLFPGDLYCREIPGTGSHYAFR